MSLSIDEITESSSGGNSSVWESVGPMTSLQSMQTSYGAQLSMMIFQLLFLSMEAMAGMPEIIGVRGA
jgi:hypothetical protein